MREKQGDRMLLAVAADLHGSIRHYDVLAGVVTAEQPGALILAGDLLAPLADAGQAIALQQAFLGAYLRPWLHRLREAAPSCAIYAIPGNWDYRTHDPTFESFATAGLWHWLDRRALPLAPNRWIAGLGDVPITPVPPKDRDRPDHPGACWSLPEAALVSEGDRLRPVSRAELARRSSLEEELLCLGGLSPAGQTIYVLHSPPAETTLDVTPSGAHVGSRAVRRFIEQHQPPLALHGHIHEAPDISGSAVERVGSSIAINPGRRDDALCTVLFELDDPAATVRRLVLPA